MGGSQSKFPPIIQRDPLPSSGAFVGGISVGQAEGCQYCKSPNDKGTCGPCRLAVAKGVSASSAKLYREFGTISSRECGTFTEDTRKVSEKEMAFDEYKSNLTSGKYYERQDNGFCSQLLFQDADLANVTTPDAIPWGKVRRPKIRKLTSGGGYSSITKLYIKPAIPFRVTFNGQPIEVSVMTLFHPSPIRIGNIQHDAVLTLGDAGDPATKTVVMIPLVGAISAGQSGQFIGRIVSYLPGLLRPNPVNGLYESIDAPTGKDWNLSMVFPGTPSEGETIVQGGYYAWNSMPPMEEYEKGRIARPLWLPDTIQYGWRPQTNQVTRFVMLAEPVSVNVFDMQTIRMLPVTPSDDAIPPMYEASLVYNTPTGCSSAKTTTAKEGFENEEERCDPFANIPAKGFDSDTVMKTLLGVIGAIAIFIGVYFALKYATDNDWGDKLMQWGRSAGKYVGTKFGTPPGAAPGPAPASGDVPERTNPMMSEETKKKAEDAAKKKAEDAAKKKAEDAAKKKAEEAEAARIKKEREAAAAGTGLTMEDTDAKKKADEEAAKKKEDEEAAEMERASAARRAKRAAMTPLEKAKEQRTNATMRRIQLEGDLLEQQNNLGMYKDRYDAANKKGDTVAADAAKEGIRVTQDRIREMQKDIAESTREVSSAETDLTRLQKAETAAVKLNAEVEAQKSAEEKEMQRLIDDSSGIILQANRVEDSYSTDNRTALKKAIADYKAAVEAAKTAKRKPLMRGTTEDVRKHNQQVTADIQDTTRKLRESAEKVQDILLRGPADGGPITKRTPEEVEKQKRMLRSAAPFRRPSGTTAASASAPAPAPAPAPAAPKRRIIAQEPSDEEDAVKAKMEEYTKELTYIEAKRKTADETLAALKAKGKTLRIKTLTSTTGEVTDVEGARKKQVADLEQLLKDLDKTKGEVETAQKNFTSNQEWLKRVQTQFGLPKQPPAQANSEEAKIEKTSEDIEAEKEKVARDLAAAQRRLALSRTTLTRGQQGRNLLSGRGRRRRRP